MKHKHKKTRQEKIIADYRHQVYILKNNNTLSNNPAPAIFVSENSYFNTHVLKDVLKTGILTCSIVAAQIIIFFLFKNHVIRIPSINY
jgi:hypothetical protein